MPQLAAFEPGLFPGGSAAKETAAKDAKEGKGEAAEAVEDEEAEEAGLGPEEAKRRQIPVGQPLFPSTLLSLVPRLVEMLTDSEVREDGSSGSPPRLSSPVRRPVRRRQWWRRVAVSEVARKVVWTCLVEDPVLFLRHFLEKITHRDRQVSLAPPLSLRPLHSLYVTARLKTTSVPPFER